MKTPLPNVSMKVDFCRSRDADEKIGAWRVDYNEHRPHSDFGNLNPKDFASLGRDRPAK